LGSWDVSSFGNDGASEWLDQLLQAKGADRVFRSLMIAGKLGPNDYLQTTESECAIAAAEIVAAGAGKPSPTLPPKASQWVQDNNFTAGAEIVDLALRVVERVSKNSELKEVWDDTDSAEDWYVLIDNLEKRLRESEVYASQLAERMRQATSTVEGTHQLCDDALVFISNSDHEGAIKKYDEALALDPNSQLAYLGKGTCYLSLGRYEKAVDNFERSLRLGREVTQAYHLRAQAYFHLGRYHECIDDLSTLIAKKPDGWDAYWIRGIAYESLGLYLKGATDFTKVIDLQPHFEEAFGRRADCYENLGSFDMAAKDRERMKKLMSH
jgi:tetratricopeptide (TPR) repeat protein